MTSVVALRHVHFESLGSFEQAVLEAGLGIRYVDACTCALDRLDPLSPGLLVVLGGPISAYDARRYPFVRDEVDLLERRLAAGRRTLGICLGAQLMAHALGARVYPARVKEIGWGPVELTPQGRESPLRHLEGQSVLHWHGDTFDLPPGATALASTPLCENQAFRWGRAALGLQFHPEVQPRAIEQWLVGHAAELNALPPDLPAQLREGARRHGNALVGAASLLLREWLREAGSTAPACS